jgi:hypothetical protein
LKKTWRWLRGSGLLSTGSTVDEAGFLFGLLDRGCAIQIQYVNIFIHTTRIALPEHILCFVTLAPTLRPEHGTNLMVRVEAARAGNPALVKHVVTDEEAAYNFKMASEKNSLYAEAQPDLDYEFAMAGPGAIEKGVELMKVDHGGVGLWFGRASMFGIGDVLPFGSV